MKKVLTFVMTLGLVALLVSAGFAAYFSDTETSTGNVFTAGSLDLRVNGQNGHVTAKVSASNMEPGQDYDAGCFTLKNSGSLPGVLTVEMTNLVSKENGRIEPERQAGDPGGQQYDPTGYNADTGDGELWDQITVKLWAGGTVIKGFSSTQDDLSDTYSVDLDTDLAAGKNIELGSGETVDLCVAVRFIDDQSDMWWGSQGGLSNNMAMTDQALFDLVLGLKQE
jgi:predicted ribosomally synthesized peptide with SipW-like signal peptide